MKITKGPPEPPGDDPSFHHKPAPPPARAPEPPAASTTIVRKAEIVKYIQDLTDGAEYQRKVLPPRPPEIPGYEFGVIYRSARGVSGDFYDFIPLGGGKLGIAIADASGKGVPAAMLTMSCHAILRSQAAGDLTPSRVLVEVNRQLGSVIPRMMFVSACYGVLDTSWHTLTLANAGHLPTILWKSKEKVVIPYPSRGPALGVQRHEVFAEKLAEESLTLDPGDRFVMITDGVSEAMAPGQREFGMELLRKRLQAEGDRLSAELLTRLMDQIDIHRGGGEQSDDITIVTGRRLT